MPDGAVYVGRPSIYGNDFRVGDPDLFRPGETMDAARWANR